MKSSRGKRTSLSTIVLGTSIRKGGVDLVRKGNAIERSVSKLRRAFLELMLEAILNKRSFIILRLDGIAPIVSVVACNISALRLSVI